MPNADADALADTPPPEPKSSTPDFLTSTPFSAFELPEAVLKGLADGGFTHCSKIQDQTLPISLAGLDVAGQAQTGTGKTAAFLVTLFTRLLSSDALPEKMPSAMVVAPTRELAHQILEEAQVIGRHTDLRMVEVVGGIDYQKQADILKRGVDIVIGTPGRMIDYIKQGVLKTDGIQMSVIDEADRLLDLGFAKDMRYILSKLPSYKQRQTMLWSATLSHRVLELTYEYMNLPEFVSVAPDQVTVAGIEQVLYHVGQDNKLESLLGLLKREEWHRLLIFVNTKAGVEWLSLKLKGNGWAAEGITGDLPQRKRFQLMDRFKKNTIQILVATDVASRGIHVEDISHVINYDLPQDAENYVHRIGRTARAGKTGRALSLACEKYVYHLEPLEEMLGYTIPVEWPEDEWLVADQCGPVSTRRQARKARTTRRADRGQTGRRRPPARTRTPGKRPASRRDSLPPRPSGYFPGTFFGFMPKTAPSAALEAPSTVDPEKPPESVEPKPAPKPKKRRRRPSKPKASGTAKAKANGAEDADAAGDSNAAAAPAPEAPSTADPEKPPESVEPKPAPKPKKRRRRPSKPKASGTARPNANGAEGADAARGSKAPGPNASGTDERD